MSNWTAQWRDRSPEELLRTEPPTTEAEERAFAWLDGDERAQRHRILVARLQWCLGVQVLDGVWGPHTAYALQSAESTLRDAIGPELRAHLVATVRRLAR